MTHRSTHTHLNNRQRRSGAAVMADALQMRLERIDGLIEIITDWLAALDLSAQDRLDIYDTRANLFRQRQRIIERLEEYQEEV